MKKQSKIQSKGTQAFNVPNTPEGNAFIATLRQYANRNDLKISIRGRGSRIQYAKDRGCRNTYGTPSTSLPKRYAEWLAVYIRSKQGDQAFHEISMKSWKQASHIRELESKRDEGARVKALEAEIEELTNKLSFEVKCNSVLIQDNADCNKKLQTQSEEIHKLRKSNYIENPPIPVSDISSVPTIVIKVAKSANVKIVQE